MRPSVSTAGQVDTHAHPLHEIQAEESEDNHRMKKRVFVKKLGLLEMLHFTATTMSKGTA